MRALALIPLLVAAACSEGGEGGETAAKAATAASIQSGQWETSSEVKSFRSTDTGQPRIQAPVGTRATASTCVPEGGTARPSPAVFAGSDYQCTYNNIYMRNGRINASLACTREGLEGPVTMSVNGTFTGSEFTATVDAASYLITDGDVQFTTQVQGRRGGECQAAAPAKQ